MKRMVRWGAMGLAAFLWGAPAFGLDPKEYRVAVVLDTQLDKFVEVSDGFKASLDKLLAASGAKAVYTDYDTKLDPTQAALVVQALKQTKPDLICTVNYPSSFADANVTLRLTDPSYRFVSENCIPVQSGVAQSWTKPGGNVTGVGVFVQYDSMLRVAKKLKPGLKEVIFVTWDAMTQLNQYFESEIQAACQRQNLQLVKFGKVASSEDEFEFVGRMDREHPDAVLLFGVSAWVHKDGTAANMAVDEVQFFQKSVKHLMTITYDETGLKGELPVGTCVVWQDLGAQLAEKGFKVLQGAKPGELPWEYPRSFNLMFNTAVAKLTGLTIPNELLTAAYRVYTDFDGHYLGQKN